MLSLDRHQWAEAAKAYVSEKRPDGSHVSCMDLAKRFGVNVSTMISGLRRRDVTLRRSRPGVRSKKLDDRVAERDAASAAFERDIARQANSKPTAISLELRRAAQVNALRDLLAARKGRIYLREIELAFGCSCFESATLAAEVAANGLAVCSFEASQGHKGARLFVEYREVVEAAPAAPLPYINGASHETLADVEKAHILESVRLNPLLTKKALAEKLGCGERTLWRKLVEYGIVKQRVAEATGEAS